MAERLGIGVQRWNNFERGYPISKDIEDKLVELIPGLSVDWIRRSSRGSLTLDLASRLDEAAAQLAVGAAGDRRTRRRRS